MAILSSEVKFITATPEMCAGWLVIAKYDAQRPVRQDRVNFLATEMERGLFLPTANISFAITPDGTQYNTNGQHTMRAIIQSGLKQRVTRYYYNVETKDDVARLYGKTDVNLSRSINDLLRPLGLAEKLGFSKSQFSSFGGAVKFMATGYTNQNNRNFHSDEYEAGVAEYAPYAQLYFAICNGLPGSMRFSAQRSSTLALALITFRYSAETFGIPKVQDFWQGALWDDGINIGDSRKVAYDHLSHTRIVNGNQPSLKSWVTPAYSIRILANCFNAYVKGKYLRRAKVEDTSSPLLVLGSPFNGT